MDARLVAGKIVKTLRKEGLRITLRKGLAQLSRRDPLEDFDVRHRTDTGGVVQLWNLEIRSPNARFGRRYQATAAQEFIAAVNLIPEDLRTFTFVDLGCGKGRTLLLASGMGFKEIVGLEFARQLVEIARKNLAQLKIGNAVAIHSDAADFRFRDDNLVIYIYNSFTEEVMQKVVSNLKSTSRKLYIVYNNPESAEIFDSTFPMTLLGSPPAYPTLQVWKREAEC